MKKISKRFLSVLLSLLMILTSLPMAAISASAVSTADNANYLFAYFTGDSPSRSSGYTQAVRFATSQDGRSFSALNSNDPVITQTVGSLSCRDPYIFLGQDGYYYCVVTDLDASTMEYWGHGQTGIIIWRSSDLVHWDHQTRIDVSEILGVDVYRFWAPQVIWDADYNNGQGAYMVYFALAANGYSAGGTKMHYMYTTDLLDQSKYTKPQPLMKNNADDARDSIDGDITYFNGTYYMFYKDENKGTICIVKSDTINGPYDTDNIIVLSHSAMGNLEGCQVWWNSDINEYIFMADRYSNQGVFAVYEIGSDLDAFYDAVSVNNDISSYYNSTSSSSISAVHPRHGSVIEITDAQYTKLSRATFNGDIELPTSGTGVNLSSNLVARYLVNDIETDESTNDYSLTSNGSVSWSANQFGSEGAAYFSNGYLYNDQVQTMLANNNNAGYTVSFLAKYESGTGSNSRFFAFSNYAPTTYGWQDSNIQNGNSHFDYYYDNKYESMYHYYNWWQYDDGSQGGRFGTSSASLNANTWHMYTITYTPDGGNGGTVNLYNDGELFSSTWSYANRAAAISEYAYFMLGASPYTDTPNLKAYMRDVRIYNKAISDDEVAKLPRQYAIDAEDAGVPGASSLRDAVNAFEKAVKEIGANGYSSLYTNLTPAYEAYKVANEVLAGTSTVSADTALANLNEALANMKKFKEHSGTAHPTIGSTSVESSFYNNVIYTEPAYEDSQGKLYDGFNDDVKTVLNESYAAAWVYGSHVYMYYPNSVVMYDGTNAPIIPVVIGFINKDHRYSLNMLYMAEEMDNFDLSESWWMGYNDSQSFMWPTANNSTIPTDPTNTSENDNAETINHNADNDTTTYRLHKNGIKYVGTPTNGYTCISSTTWIMKGQYTYAWSDQRIDGYLTDSVPDIDIINYAKLTTALKTTANNADYRNYLNNIAEGFTTGGLESIFAAFDAATTLDPNTGCSYFKHTYDYADDMDNAALLCGTDIDKAVDMLGKVNISADTVDYQKLVKAINAYEKFMADMDGVYTNLEDAYNKYLLAVEYRDAYDYGDRTGADFINPTLSQAAENLTDAISNMQPYSVPTITSNVQIKYPDDANEINSAYHQNIAYWGSNFPGEYTISSATFSGSTIPNGNWAAKLTFSNSAQIGVTYPNTVLIYDGVSGNTPQMPVYATHYYDNSKWRYMFYLYPTDGTNSHTHNPYFELDDYWTGSYNKDWGKGNNIAKSWNTAKNDYSAKSNKTDSSSIPNNTKYIVGYKSGNYKYSAIAANSMSYQGSGNNTEYYDKYNLIWYGNCGSDSSKLSTNASDNVWAQNDATSIYVVNYAPIKDKINTITINKGELDVTKYTEGGLTSWFKQLDALTGFNPSTYFTSSTDSSVATDVTKCASDIKTLLNTTTNNMPTTVGDSSITKDSKNVPNKELYDESGNLKDIDDVDGIYSKLKVAILEAETAPSSQGCIMDEYWNDFNDDLAAAKAAAYKIATDKSGTSTGKEGYSDSTVATLAQNLDDAINALYAISSSSHPLHFSYQEKGTHDGYFQCYSNNAHVLEIDEDNHESTVMWFDMTAYDALDRVYYTLDKTKYSSQSIIEEGRESFDAVKSDVFAAGLTPEKIVDKGIADLLTAINESNEGTIDDKEITKRHSVSFNVYTVDGEGVASDTPIYTESTKYKDVTYGTVAELDMLSDDVLTALASANIDSTNLVIQKLTINGATATQPKKETKVSVYVQDDTTVNVYVSLPKAADKHYITINNISSRPIYTIEINEETMDETIVSYDNSNPNVITIGGKDYTVPNSMTYTITGFTLLGGYYDCGDKFSMSITELMNTSGDSSLTFRPKVTLNKSENDKYTFKMDNVVIAENVNYDYRLRVKSSFVDTDDEYAYAIVFYNSDNNIFVPVTYIDDDADSYVFFANRSMDFYTLTYKKADATNGIEAGYYLKVNGLDGEDLKITDEDLIFYLDYKMPMVYSYSEITGDDLGSKTENGVTNYYSNKWTTRSAFTANVGGSALYGDVTITESGTLRTTDSLRETQLVIENVGKSGYSIANIIAKSRDPESNQYSYSLSTGDTSTDRTVLTRAYVKYSYYYNGTKIDAIAYGPVCESHYGDHTNG